MVLKFTKAQALGNDFVIVDDRSGRLDLPPAAIQRICDRRFGVGADGVLLLQSSDAADFGMRIMNRDGSEADMCGNGIRCLAVYVRERGLSRETSLTIETLAGVKTVDLKLAGERVEVVSVDMGEPTDIRSEHLEVTDMSLEATCLSIGNPHCVTFVGSAKGAPVDRLGPVIEHLPLFPNRTNVEFVEVSGPDELTMRVWERGVGETLACGTGASASLVAAAFKKLVGRRAVVHLAGGDLLVEWGTDEHVHLSGPASIVYSGELAESDSIMLK